jgi:hypothetical protein
VPHVWGFVSGHDFSRAVKAANDEGLYPLRLYFPLNSASSSVRHLNLPGGHYLCSIQELRASSWRSNALRDQLCRG